MSSLSCLARAAPRIARASAHRPPPAPSAGAWRPRGFASFHQPSPRTSPFANLPPRTKAILLASGIALLGFDAYHFLYVHEPPPILDPERYVRFELAEKDKVAPDTWRLVFKHIPKPELTASQGQRSAVSAEWPIVSHLSVKNSEMQIQRPYTPTAVGPDTFEIIVKRYSDGFMTPWLVARKPGEKVEIRGPLPSFAYRPNAFKEIGMVSWKQRIPGTSIVERIRDMASRRLPAARGSPQCTNSPAPSSPTPLTKPASPSSMVQSRRRTLFLRKNWMTCNESTETGSKCITRSMRRRTLNGRETAGFWIVQRSRGDYRTERKRWCLFVDQTRGYFGVCFLMFY